MVKVKDMGPKLLKLVMYMKSEKNVSLESRIIGIIILWNVRDK